MPALRYSDFAGRIDVDAFYEGIDWYPEDSDSKGNDMGFCPDPWGLHKHGDTTGKFAIHREKRVYNCFVCGGGTLLSLAMAVKDLNEDDALTWLSQYAGEDRVTDEKFEAEVDALMVTKKMESHIWPWFNSNVLTPWQHDISEIGDWIQSRGFSAEVTRKFKVGYDEQHHRYSKEEYVGPAVIFPHYWRDKLVGWQERWLDDNRPDFIPKYTNTRDFPKRETLFNGDNPWTSETGHPVVVCESVPTVLFLASLDIPAVATFGSSVTPTQMRLLRRFQNGVILAPDNDKPGEKFKEQLSEYLGRYVKFVKATMPVPGEGSDLGDLVGEDPQFVREIIAQAELL